MKKKIGRNLIQKDVLKKAVILFIIVYLSGYELFACSSVVAGKNATKDGSVLFGHNEDDPKVPTLLRRVERILHKDGEMIEMWDIDLPSGKKGVIPQKKGWTFAYLWTYMPGLKFSDSYLNEWGVSIASHNCVSSREDNPELTPGIGYWLRRVVAERARSAKEGVEIMAEMVDRYGYASSGRTYVIADPKDVWFFSVVWGKTWCAQRVPDNHVAFIPNYYTIREVKFGHPDFLYSDGLKRYAEKRGWYNPKKQKIFDFAKIFNDEKTQANLNSKLRHYSALERLSDESFDMDNLPFSVMPSKKIDMLDISRILRSHYENTEWGFKPYPLGPKLYQNEKGQWINKHTHQYENSENIPIRTICAQTTQESFIMQLRGHMPDSIGNVMWRSQGRPCTSIYIPWYSGIRNIPEPYRIGKSNRLNKDGNPEPPVDHYAPNASEDMESAYWAFDKMTDMVDESDGEEIDLLRKEWKSLELSLISKQSLIEKFALGSINENEDDLFLRDFLTNYTAAYALSVYHRTLKFIRHHSKSDNP